VINVCKNNENINEQKILFFDLIVIQCSDVDCLNNGTCLALTTGYYRCICPPGYGGSYCQYSKKYFIMCFVD
jgi:hypothetical protein